MRLYLLLFLLSLPSSRCLSATLAFSNYLKDGLKPSALASDMQGNLYLAGSMVTDPASGVTSAVVAKLDLHGAGFLYFTYLDSLASDSLTAIVVDGSGNAYVTGSTINPNFPATGGNLGTAPTSNSDPRPFVTKLNSSGTVVYSVLLGGSASSTGQAITLTPKGQIVISGNSIASGFPVTSGAYSVGDSKSHPFLMELDATGSTLIFSATGIGGNALALDASGNIFVAGSTPLLDYPTTPGAYQTTFTPAFSCTGQCQFGFPGLQQYVSKVNTSGSQLIYSTGLNGTAVDRSSSVSNGGLTVDAAGNAYVTGILTAGPYPFTTLPPANSPYEYGFISKLDSNGATLLWSVPVGGAVATDSSGSVYVGGTVNSFFPFVQPPMNALAPPAALAAIPAQCLPNGVTANSETYLMKLDPLTGNVLDAQWIDGSVLGLGPLTFAGGKVWTAGNTQRPDVPFTPGAVASARFMPGVLQGTYLSAMDFTVPATAPQVACVLDGGNLMHVGPVAPNQLITLFGSGLGPVTGINAPDGLDTSIAGVSVTFDGSPAQLLYASASQINLLTPKAISNEYSTVMQVSVNGLPGLKRQFPVTPTNPNLFATPAAPTTPAGIVPSGCLGSSQTVIAVNSDGSLNVCTNPAKLGTVVSVYVHGRGETTCLCYSVAFGAHSVELVNAVAVNSFLDRLDVLLPSTFAFTGLTSGSLGAFALGVELNGLAVGPLSLPANGDVSTGYSLMIWATM